MNATAATATPTAATPATAHDEITDAKTELIGLIALRDEITHRIEMTTANLYEADPDFPAAVKYAANRVLKLMAAEGTDGMRTLSPYIPAANSPACVPAAASSTGQSPAPQHNHAAKTPDRPANALSSTNPTSESSVAKESLPVAVLKLAKGWEDKLISSGCVTVGDLAKFVADGKLVPGALPRIGPDAIEKIKTALNETLGWSVVAQTPRPAAATPARPQQSLKEILDEGKQFAANGYKASENPHPKGSSEWHMWDSGWQEHFATHEANDEATREATAAPAVAADTAVADADPQPGEFPEVDLSGVSTPENASPVPVAAAADTGGIDMSDL